MLKDLIDEGLVVNIKNKDGKFIPVNLKVDLRIGRKQLIVSIVTEWGQKLAEESFKMIKEFDEYLHSAGIHEKEEHPSLDQSQKVIINLW